MKKLIVGNWKLNPQTLKGAIQLARAVDKKGVIIAPPHTFLEEVARTLQEALPCAQDIFWQDKGSFTGGVSPKQLKTIGVKYTIVGHSSRREMGERDAEVNRKVKLAIKDFLNVILCVGEPSEIHQRGRASVQKFVNAQIKKGLARVTPQNRLVVAYEPIWAIGTKNPDTPEDSSFVITQIKETLKTMGWKGVKVIYGGSVNAGNAKGFLAQKEIDGLLVGMVSLDAKEFNKIIKANG